MNEATSSQHSLSQSLAELKNLSGESGASLGEILNAFESKGFGLLLIILALPSALPVPAAGYSTPFGLILILLGLQMLAGRTRPWLPEKARKMRFSAKMTNRMASAGMKFFGKIEHLVRPRLHWIHQRGGRVFLSLLVIFMSCLMILPIPTTNTAPAMVIFLVGVALCEEDGLFGMGAGLVGLAAAALYGFIIYLAVVLFQEYGWEGVQNVKAVLKEKLGLGE